MNRYVSIYITAVLVRTGCSANSVTVTSICVGLAGAACFLAPGLGIRLLGAGLLYVSFLLDQVDGEVARYFESSSLTGSYLDEIRHLLIYPVPMMAIGAGLSVESGHVLGVLAGCAAAVSLTIIRFNTNARFLLISKKLHHGINGAIQMGVERRENREAQRPPGVGIKAVVSRALAIAFYATCNQVAILLLVCALQVATPWSSPNSRVAALSAYASLAGVLVILDVWTMVRGRLEKATAALLDEAPRETGSRA